MDLMSAFTGLLLSLVLHQVLAKRDIDLYCGACQTLVDEVQYAIEQVDPKRTIEVGFRIDPQGRRKAKKIPYALSEVHLTELMEDICSKLQDYAESKNPETRKYVRFNARNEQDTVELENVTINNDITKALKLACQNIIEEHEEDIIKAFQTSITKTKVCQDIVGVCHVVEPESEKLVSEKSEL